MMTNIGSSRDVKASQSLWELAFREADTFKWLESERRGYDVGPVAYREWCRRFWRIFCRYRRIEHLLGERRIAEFDDASFGCLKDSDLRHRPVVRFVIRQFADEGWENLDFVFWGPRSRFAPHELHETLSLVDVNSAHFDPPWS